jgi:tetratricopeptide (TPR) repeat protein
MTNLSASKQMAGEFRDAVRITEQGLRLSSTEGDGQAATFLRGGLCAGRYSLGDWDEALVLAGELLSAPESFRYLDGMAYEIRSLIFEARGDLAASRAEHERAVAIARESGEAQQIWPVITSAARQAYQDGRGDEAVRLMREVEDSLAETDAIGDPDEWHVVLMLTLCDLDRGEMAGRLAERLPDGFWRDVCGAVLDEELEVGADMLGAKGEQPLQADLRVRAARRLVDDGRPAEAERQLSLARTFYRAVGATAFLQAADEVLAAAS